MVTSERCGSSSVGRVSASQAECRGFEPRLPLSNELTDYYSMRIQKELIERIAKRTAAALIEGDFLIWEDRPEKLEAIIHDIITDDLMVEDKLNEEVKTLIESRTQDYERDMMDYGRVFQMVKTKLARERGLIL